APSDPTPMNLAAQRKALTDKKKEVRLAAVQQLGSWGNGASLAAPDLARLVHDDPDEAVANHAAMALAQIGPFGAKELAKAARSPTVAVRQRALVALSKMGPAAKEAVSVLRETLEDRHPPFRALAAVALGEIGTDAKAATPDLLKLLNDSDAEVRKQVALALASIGPECVPALREMLADEDFGV